MLKQTNLFPGDDRCGNTHGFTAQVHLGAGNIVHLTWRRDDEWSCSHGYSISLEFERSKPNGKCDHRLWISQELRQDETGHTLEEKPPPPQNPVCYEPDHCSFSKERNSVFAPRDVGGLLTVTAREFSSNKSKSALKLCGLEGTLSSNYL